MKRTKTIRNNILSNFQKGIKFVVKNENLNFGNYFYLKIERFYLMLKCQENSLKYIIDSTKCEFLDLQEISQPSFLIDILPRKLKVQTRMVQFIQRTFGT